MASSRTKKCSNPECAQENPQPLEKFSKEKKAADGRASSCKECKKAYAAKRRADPVINKRKQDQKKLYDKTPAAQAKRRKSDNARAAKPWGKLQKSVKAALKRFAVLKQDTTRSRELFGCTLAEMRAHIESLWEDWMNWDNYGINTGEYDKFWQFDHIIPYKAFPGEELEKYQKIVCWYKNVQPMCAKKNNEKKHDFKPEDKQALIRKYQLEEIQAEVLALM